MSAIGQPEREAQPGKRDWGLLCAGGGDEMNTTLRRLAPKGRWFSQPWATPRGCGHGRVLAGPTGQPFAVMETSPPLGLVRPLRRGPTGQPFAVMETVP